MKLALTVAATLLHVWSSAASADEAGVPCVRIHPRELVPRDGRDCGKFVMYCEKAAGACNNACYHINCVDKSSAAMVYVNILDMVALLMVFLALMVATITRKIENSPDAKQATAPFATKCRSAKSSMIRLPAMSEIR